MEQSEQQQSQQKNSMLLPSETGSSTAVKTFDELFSLPDKVISSPTYNKAALANYIFSKCYQFLTVNSPADNNREIALQFADDVMEVRLDWKPQDIDLFFKTIRQRQDIAEFRVFGNKITGLKLSEMILAYEELRAEARENYLKNQFKAPVIEKSNADATKYTREILNRLNANFEANRPTVNESKNEIDPTVKCWLKEFDELRREQQTTRFIKLAGKQMNIDDYLKYRMEQHEEGK